MEFSLTEKQREELLNELRVEDKKKYADRIRCILLLSEGKSYSEISRYLYLNERNIRRIAFLYKAGGLAGLVMMCNKGSGSHLRFEQNVSLIHYVEENYVTDAKELILYCTKQFGVKYSLSGMHALLKREGYVYKKTKLIPSKGDSVRQKEFVEWLDKELKDEQTEVFFMDGVHPTHNTRPTRVWCKKGEDKEIKANTGRTRININGALNATHPTEVVTVQSDSINAQSTVELLQKIESQCEKKDANTKIIVVADNAKYYKNALVSEYLKNSKITILHLPPYSPNLNLIERLWKFMYKKAINNVFFEKFADFEKAILDFFKNIPNYSEELASLMTLKFHIRSDSG